MKPKIFMICAILLLLTGCWSSHEINTLGISVCIGIDKSENGYIVSEQVINPKAIASQKGTQESPVVVYTAEGKSIEESITKLTVLAPRKIYSSHLRMVILSEDVAKDGIQSIVDYLMRYHEYRTDFYFAIAKGSSSKDILSVLTPIESIPGIEMYTKLKTSSLEWAPTKAVDIIDLINDIAADGKNPVITGIEITDGETTTESTKDLATTGDFAKLMFTDLGVFRKDKLVGWLNENQAKGYNYIVGDVKRTVGQAGDDKGNELTYDVMKAKSKIKVIVENGKPRIDVTINAEFVIVGVQGDMDVSNIENMATITKWAEEKAKAMCEDSVYRAQKDLKTDIFGFGEKIHANYPSYWHTVKDSWNEVFMNVPVNIKVTAKFLSTGDITKPLFKKND